MTRAAPTHLPRPALTCVGLLLTLVALVSLAPALAAAAPPSAPGTQPPGSEATVLETLAERGGFTLLLEALESAGLSGELATSGPFTLFAPTDEALRSLPEETLLALSRPEHAAERVRLLRYHVAPGRWTLEDMGRQASVVTLDGDELRLRTVAAGGYSLDVARLVEWDVPCSDGVVHVLDAVLLPPDLTLATDAQLLGGGVHTYTVDPDHSTIVFRVVHMGVGAAYGWFRRFQGELVVDAEDPRGSSVLLAVEVGSLDTGNTARDSYLQTRDFFDATQHPVMTFRSTAIVPREDGALDVEGELSLRGVTRTVTCRAEQLGEGRFGPETYKVGFEAVLTIRRSDFGMTYGIPGVAADEVRITIALEGNRPLETQDEEGD